MIDLRNRLAVVSGGGRDIGRAISIQLARCGASVAFCYRVHSQPFREAGAIAMMVDAAFRQTTPVVARIAGYGGQAKIDLGSNIPPKTRRQPFETHDGIADCQDRTHRRKPRRQPVLHRY